MDPKLREKLGQVAFEQSSFVERSSTWGTTSEEVREEYRRIAEAVAMELAQVTLSVFQQMTFAFTGKHVDMHLE